MQEERDKELEKSINFNQSFDSSASPLKFNPKNISQYNFINNLHNKMNQMKVRINV